MLWLIKSLIFGHVHKWKTVDEAPLMFEGKRAGTVVYLECEKCGIRKRQDLY